MSDMAGVLRTAIRDSRKRFVTVAQDTGVSAAAISDFMAGGDIGLKTANKIAEHFGFDLKRTTQTERITERKSKARVLWVTLRAGPERPKKRRPKRKTKFQHLCSRAPEHIRWSAWPCPPNTNCRPQIPQSII